MNRLTRRDRGGNALMDCDRCHEENGPSWCGVLPCRNRLLRRLAEYEDTGLTPEQITPKRGRWEMLSYDEAICTCCGYDRNTPFDSTREAKERWSELPPYCEMCGAFLKEETDGKTDDPQF